MHSITTDEDLRYCRCGALCADANPAAANAATALAGTGARHGAATSTAPSPDSHGRSDLT